MTEKTTTAAAMAATAGPATAPRDQVTVRMPAEGAYLSVLRTATAGLAARLDFTLDEIEDLRIAVDEACAMLLHQAIPGSALECSFALGPRHDDDLGLGAEPDAAAAGQRHLRLDGADRAGGQRGRVRGAGRPAHDCHAQEPPGIGVSVTGETEIALTEEFDAMAAAMPEGLAAAGEPDSPDLGPAGLGGPGLDGAGLDKAAVERADLDGADLDSAALERPDLESPDLDGADLESADLDAADLDGAEVSQSDPGSSPGSADAVKPDTESPRIQHGTRERSHARALFERLSALPAGRRGAAADPRRAGGAAPAAGGVPRPPVPQPRRVAG